MKDNSITYSLSSKPKEVIITGLDERMKCGIVEDSTLDTLFKDNGSGVSQLGDTLFEDNGSGVSQLGEHFTAFLNGRPTIGKGAEGVIMGCPNEFGGAYLAVGIECLFQNATAKIKLMFTHRCDRYGEYWVTVGVKMTIQERCNLARDFVRTHCRNEI